MKKKGRFFRILLTVVIVILGLILLTGTGLYINYRLTRVEPQDYLSGDFLLYTRIDSIEKIYGELIDLRVLEAVLSRENLADIHLALNNFKNGDLARHPVFKQLLDIEAFIQLDKQMEPFIVLDMGYRSIITRLLPLVNSFYKPKNLDLNILQRGNLSIFQYPLNENVSLYLTFHKNLILVSTNPEIIQASFTFHQKNSDLTSRKDLDGLPSMLREKGFLNLFIDTEELLPLVLGEENPLWHKIDTEAEFTGPAVLNLSLTNEQISLSLYSPVEIKGAELSQFLQKSPPESSRISRLLPEKSTLYSRIRFSSVWDMYTLFLHLQNGEYDDILKKAEEGAKALFKLSIREILQWIGSDAGVFYLENFTDPVIFLEIGNTDELDSFFKKLTDSLFLKEENELLINNVRIRQIGFPPFLQRLIHHFNDQINEPYFIELEDYLILCMDPEALADVYTSYAGKKTLQQSSLYKKLSRGFPEEAALSVYFDLSENKPLFLYNQSLILTIMEYYQRGLLALDLKNESLNLELTAVPAEIKTVRLLPGYPVQLTGSTGFRYYHPDKSIPPTVLTMDDAGILYISNLKGRIIHQRLLGKDSVILSSPEGESSICILTGQKKFFKLDSELRTIKPFPVTLEMERGFEPLWHSGKLYFYSQARKKIMTMDGVTGELSEIPRSFTKDVVTRPSILEDYMAVHPSDLSGLIELFNIKSGESVPGWPVRAGSRSLQGPQLILKDNRALTLFLTQAGNLFLWGPSGKLEKGFPVALEGTFYAPVQVYHRGKSIHFICLNSDGTVFEVTEDGKIRENVHWLGVRGKVSRAVEKSDLKGNPDGWMVTGNRNSLLLTDLNLIPLEDFPVKGHYAPYIFDFDGDGSSELAVKGLYNEFYIYSLNSEN